MSNYEMGELFHIARQYGRVNVFTNDDGTYHASIKFNTIKHTQLEADSDFKRKTPEDALLMAILVAQKIADSLNDLNAQVRNAKRLPQSSL